MFPNLAPELHIFAIVHKLTAYLKGVSMRIIVPWMKFNISKIVYPKVKLPIKAYCKPEKQLGVCTLKTLKTYVNQVPSNSKSLVL